MRPAIHTGIIGAVVGYLFGHWLGNLIASGYPQVQNCGTNNYADNPRLPLRDGRLAGRPRGLQRPVRQMVGRRARRRGRARGVPAWPGSSGTPLDHKVVGIQYLVGMIGYFLTGGLLAMAIRTELLSPTYHVFSPADVHRRGRRARHDDDHDDVFADPRSVRQLPGAAADRLEADGVPADRGALVLAHPRRVLRAAVRPSVRRVPAGWTGYAPLSDPGHPGQTPTRSRSA